MNDSDTPRTKNPLEWTVFGISLMLVLATLGLLLAAALHVGNGPAKLTITTGEAQLMDGRTIIPVIVKNDGGEVAENVEVKVTLGEGAGLQEAGFTLDFIPRGAERKGVVSFTAENGRSKPVASIVGYGTP